MKFERKKKQNQHNTVDKRFNKNEEKDKKMLKDGVKNQQYTGNVFMKYPLSQDRLCWDIQKDFLVNMARNNHDDGAYRLRERKKSSCATGSCSEYGNYLTIRPDYPSENDIRSRRSFYNLPARRGYNKSTPTNSDVATLYESRSDKRRSGKNTRQSSNNELIDNTKSELIPLVNSREMGADSHFIQSRLMLRNKRDKKPNRMVEQKKYEYYSSKESENRTPRFSSFDSLELPEKKGKQHYENDDSDEKDWTGPLDLPLKSKTPKFSSRRSSPSGNDKDYFNKYTEYALNKQKLQSNKMKSVSCSTDSSPKATVNKKNNRKDALTCTTNNKHRAPNNLNLQNNSMKKPMKNIKKYEEERGAYYEDGSHNRKKHSGKFEAELNKKKLQSSPKPRGTPTYNHSYKNYSKEIESPKLNELEKSRPQSSNSKNKEYVLKRKSILKEFDDIESIRKDTIASSLKYSKKYQKPYDLKDMKSRDDLYKQQDLHSISEVLKAKKKLALHEPVHELKKNLQGEKRSMSKTPERQKRLSTYFNSNLKVNNTKGKMRKLDVSSDCGVACDDKETDKYHNIGLKYGRQSIDPALLRKKRDHHHKRGYLDLKEQPNLKATPKKKRLPSPKERVSFQDEKLDFRNDQDNTSDYRPNSPTSIARRPCIKNYSNPVGPETCAECVSNKTKSSANREKDLSICPIDRKCKTNELSPEVQLPGVPYLKKQAGPTTENPQRSKKLFNDSILKKTNSEDLSKNFCHKTVLENYPDEAEHLRDYSEEFTKQPFRSTQFNPGGHDPPPLKPKFYPKPRSKPYDYSGNLLPDNKRPNDPRKLSPTMYVKRRRKELSYKSTIGEKFFKHNRDRYIDMKKSKEPTNENVTADLNKFKSNVAYSDNENHTIKNKYQNFQKMHEKHYNKTPHAENNYNVAASAQKNLSLATINDKYKSLNYTDSREKKYDEKMQKSRSGFTTRPNSRSSTENSTDAWAREMKEPDNDVISNLLGSYSKPESQTSRSAEKDKLNFAKGNKYEIVYLNDKPNTPNKQFPLEHFEPKNKNNLREGFYNKSYSEEQPFYQRNEMPNEGSHTVNKQRNLNDSLDNNSSQPKDDFSTYQHSNKNKQDDSSNKIVKNQTKSESPGPNTDWRMQPKPPSNDFKMFHVNPDEVELAPDEKLLPNMIGHAAMHNWQQAESYFFSKKRPKPNVGSRLKMPPYFRKKRLGPDDEYDDDVANEEKEQEQEEGDDDDDDDDDDEEEDGDGTANNKKKKNPRKTMTSIPIIISDPNAPVPAKRFKNQRINPHSRFDAGYDFLQTADSNTSIETLQSYTKKLYTSAIKPIKRESAIKRFAKRLFSFKPKERNMNIRTESEATESSNEDSPKSMHTSSTVPKPKRKVSFSVPLYL